MSDREKAERMRRAVWSAAHVISPRRNSVSFHYLLHVLAYQGIFVCVHTHTLDAHSREIPIADA